jgi:hypothetical protein
MVQAAPDGMFWRLVDARSAARAVAAQQPHPPPQRGMVHEWIEAERPDRPGVGHAEPYDALHGRGLAGAVAPERAEDLALGTVKLTSSTATVAPYRLCRCATSMIATLAPKRLPGRSVRLERGIRNDEGLPFQINNCQTQYVIGVIRVILSSIGAAGPNLSRGPARRRCGLGGWDGWWKNRRAHPLCAAV